MKMEKLDKEKYHLLYFPVLSQLNYRLITPEKTIRITDHYKRILVNSYYLKKNYAFLIGALRKQGLEVMADSGGWQFQLGKLKESDLGKIFEFQKNFGDWIFQLDLPNYSATDINDWKKSIERTRYYTQYFLKMYGLKDKYIPVLHGNTYEKLELWNDMLNDFDYKNIAISTKVDNTVSNSLGYVMAMLWWLKHSNKKVNLLHLLGYTKMNHLPMFIYLREMYSDRINYLSLDSITPNFLGIHAKYQYNDEKGKVFDINLRKNKAFRNGKFPCDCDFCQFANKRYGTVKDFMAQKPQTIYTLLYLHHLNYYVKRMKDAYKEATEIIPEEGIRNYLMRRYYVPAKKSLWSRSSIKIVSKAFENLDYVDNPEFKALFESIAIKSGLNKKVIKSLEI